MTRRNMYLCAFTLTLILTFAGCQTAPAPEPKRDVAADMTAINALDAQFTAAVNSNEAAAVAATYADDAIGMFPNQAALEGKQAIQAAYEALFKENAVKIALTPLETRMLGDWAYERGNYTATVTPKSGTQVEGLNKYQIIHKRQPDGSWKIYRIITNSNSPTPAVAAKKK